MDAANDKNRLNYLTLIIEGNNLMSAQRFDDAIARYQMALEVNPTFHMTFAMLGRAHHKKGDIDAAIENYKRSLHLRPGQNDVLMRLAKAYDQKGMKLQAAAAYDLLGETDVRGKYKSVTGTGSGKRRRRSRRRTPTQKFWDNLLESVGLKHKRRREVKPVEWGDEESKEKPSGEADP